MNRLRLGERVLEKGLAILRRLLHGRDIPVVEELNIQIGENALHLPYLPLVSRRQDYLHCVRLMIIFCFMLARWHYRVNKPLGSESATAVFGRSPRAARSRFNSNTFHEARRVISGRAISSVSRSAAGFPFSPASSSVRVPFLRKPVPRPFPVSRYSAIRRP